MSTYAMDCIASAEADRRKTLQRIEHHDDRALDDAIEIARRKFGGDFWILLHGIDAYMERRRRRESRRIARQARRDLRELAALEEDQQ